MSFFKKFMSGNSMDQGSSKKMPSGVSTMNSAVRDRLSKGVEYNMKVVIRGDKNTGKSQLFNRIQGIPFDSEYNHTDEIKVGHILWTYPKSGDACKVEIWDVVDKAKKKKQLAGLKFASHEIVQEDQIPSLDAEFMDVYKSCHAVVMLFDITKAWTWNYIESELPKVPCHIPILLLGNFRDMGHHRDVTTEKATSFIRHLDRPVGSSDIKYYECSMLNSYGLKFIHQFLNIPFLFLQREMLINQMERNSLEMDSVRTDLFAFERDPANSYDLFSDSLNKKRRADAEKLAPPPGPESDPSSPNATLNTASVTASPQPPPKTSFLSKVVGKSPQPVVKSKPSPPVVSSSSTDRPQIDTFLGEKKPPPPTKVSPPQPSPSYDDSPESSADEEDHLASAVLAPFEDEVDPGDDVVVVSTSQLDNVKTRETIEQQPAQPRIDIAPIPSLDNGHVDGLDDFLGSSGGDATGRKPVVPIPERLSVNDNDDDGSDDEDRPVIADIVDDFEDLADSPVRTPAAVPAPHPIEDEPSKTEEPSSSTITGPELDDWLGSNGSMEKPHKVKKSKKKHSKEGRATEDDNAKGNNDDDDISEKKSKKSKKHKSEKKSHKKSSKQPGVSSLLTGEVELAEPGPYDEL